MKNLQTVVKENSDIRIESEKYCIWQVTNRNNWELLFSGTKEECDEHFEEEGFDTVNEQIHPNVANDQWENPVDGIGFVTFENGETFSYSL